ncbi:hypothetical protein DAEQUDRAFT_732743 [Daedalea quercina L-15889]|uniref:Uncharacterized protein n=1 Tax=Daedalea quercina L-15889 TaxID=1314783 RepID=A0A165LFQ2_9APHY|nr:hypothetical protein DAEQUDRAFT_732743 [Daedalea quercina L-15889]
MLQPVPPQRKKCENDDTIEFTAVCALRRDVVSLTTIHQKYGSSRFTSRQYTPRPPPTRCAKEGAGANLPATRLSSPAHTYLTTLQSLIDATSCAAHKLIIGICEATR